MNNNPMEILVYTEKRTNRLRYTLDEVFARRLGFKLIQTTRTKDFIGYDGIKLNYSIKSLEGGYQIRPHGLLAGKSLQPVEFEKERSEVPCLFSENGAGKQVDVLATCFYFLALYQEYLPYRSDEHGRFQSSESIQTVFGCLQKAFVDGLVKGLSEEIKKIYPSCSNQPVNEPNRVAVTVDVDQMFYYREKGLARSILSTIVDTVRKPSSLKTRLPIQLFGQTDPIDIYQDIIEICLKYGVNPIFFIQVGEPSRFDRNNPIHLPAVTQKVNELALRSEIGLHPSYFSCEDGQKLELELGRLRSICSSRINVSRQHYMRWRLPDTLLTLAELGITFDYTLGFPDVNGFRAGTAHPFKFFNLQKDEVVDITLMPTHFSDIVSMRLSTDPEEEMMAIKNECNSYGGTFCTMWHPEVLIGIESKRGSYDLLQTLLHSEVVK